VGAASLARSTLTRVASHAHLATSGCAEDLGVELATVIDSVATHHVAAAAAAQRLSGDFCLNESLKSIRLLDRTRQSPVASVTRRNDARYLIPTNVMGTGNEPRYGR
jgi:hypothetical protein